MELGVFIPIGNKRMFDFNHLATISGLSSNPKVQAMYSFKTVCWRTQLLRQPPS
jgi:hypothetical protein